MEYVCFERGIDFLWGGFSEEGCCFLLEGLCVIPIDEVGIDNGFHVFSFVIY